MLFKDPEKQDFSKIFLLLSAALLLCLGYEVYEEAIGRQPWIRYQDDFRKLEVDGLEKELNEARSRFERKEKQLASAPLMAEPNNMSNFKKRLQEAEAILNSGSYREALALSAKLKAKLEELYSEHRFIKADLDAAYYNYDKSLEQAGDTTSDGMAKITVNNTGQSIYAKTDEKVVSAMSVIEKLKDRLAKNEELSEEIKVKLAAATKKLSLEEDNLNNVKKSMDEATFEIVTLEERIAKVKTRPSAIQQVVVSGLGEYQMVDRCQTCHQGVARKDFEQVDQIVFRAHPDHERLFKHHPIEKNGCISCHEGQGRALNMKEAHEGDKHWQAPILPSQYLTTSCLKCHADAPLLAEASNVARGATLFQTKGCVACHKVDKSPYLTRNEGKIGPDLTRIKHKVSDKWLVQWIMNPKKMHPRTIMPEFGVKGKGMPQLEAIAIASYLAGNRAEFRPSPNAIAYGAAHKASDLSVAAGKKLFSERGCMGCHDLGDYKAVGPRHVALDGIGAKTSKTWLYTWLEDPKQVSPTTIMPKFSLTNDELANLTDYLSSLKEPENKSVMLAANLEGLHTAANFDSGRRLIKKYGCYSCHAIPGFENNVEKIAPELTDFAAKDPHLLFWGTKNKVPHKDRNWYSWTRAKLDEPKNFETDRIEAIMPNFHLSASETDDLLSFLKTLSSQKTVAAEHRRELRSGEADKIAGWQAMNHYGCIGCHSLYRKDETKLTGGFHKTAVAQYGVIAPNLSPEGDRVRKDWLGDFLKTPYKMRPYLNATMPAFNLDEEERDSLVAYFKSNATMTEYLGKKESSFDSPVSDPVAGKNLLSRYQCVTCHKVNGQELPASNQLRWYKDMEQARKMAPDLVHAVDKLNPSWANRWMENPHAIMPDTTMPFTALSREDASAIRSYLNSLGQSQPTAAK